MSRKRAWPAVATTHLRRLTRHLGTGAMAACIGLLVAGVGLAAEKVQLQFWSWDQNAQPIDEELARRFSARTPGVNVQLTVEPWTAGGYWDKLAVLNANRTPPDIYYMSVAYAWDYANTDWVLSMEPFVRELPKQDYFWPIMDDLRYPTRKDELYAFPFAWVASLLFYNQTLFDQNGLAYPDSSWDWYQLREVARKLTKDQNGDGKPEVWGFLSSSSHEVLDAVVYSWGGAVLDESQRRSLLDQPKSIEAIQFLVDLIHKDRVAPPPGTSASFATGNLAMQVVISPFINSLRKAQVGFNWDVAMVPKGPARRVIYGGPDSVVISKYTRHPKEAWEFLRFYLTQRKATDVPLGKVPVYKPLALTPEWLAWNNPPRNMQVILESAAYVRGADFGTTRWMDWRVRDLNNALAPAFRGELAVPAAAANAVRAINAVLSSTTCQRCRP